MMTTSPGVLTSQPSTITTFPTSTTATFHQQTDFTLNDPHNTHPDVFKIPSIPSAAAGAPPPSHHHNDQSTVEANSSGVPPGAPPTSHHEAAMRQLRLMKRTSVEVLPGYSTMDCINEHEHEPKSKQKQSETHHDIHEDLRAPSAFHHGQQNFDHIEPLEVRIPGGPSLRTVNSDPHLVGLVTNQSPMTSEHNPMISMSGRDLNSPFLMQSDSSSSLIPAMGLTLDDVHRDTMAMETGKIF